MNRIASTAVSVALPAAAAFAGGIAGEIRARQAAEPGAEGPKSKTPARLGRGFRFQVLDLGYFVSVQTRGFCCLSQTAARSFTSLEAAAALV